MRLIDADALLERWCSEVCKPKPNCNEDCMIYDYLTMNFLSPTIEPVKRGRWIIRPHKMMGECPCCSECQAFFGEDYDMMQYFKYCPNCGAKMEGENNAPEKG